MQGHTHALIGLTTVAVINHLAPFMQPHMHGEIPTGAAVCAGAAILGALLPDVDAEESSIKGAMGVVGTVASASLRLVGVSHRGLTHYGITTFLVLVASWMLGTWLGFPDVGLAFGLGYLSHVVIADAMTKHGVPLLWPYPGNFHLLPKGLRITTGGMVEKLIFLVTGVFLLFLLPGMIPPELWKLFD